MGDDKHNANLKAEIHDDESQRCYCGTVGATLGADCILFARKHAAEKGWFGVAV
jgi:hypothetical protein